MINLEEARRIVQAFLSESGEGEGVSYCLLEDKTQEFESGWVFRFTRREINENPEEENKYVGGGPLIVDKNDGGVFRTGGKSIEFYIDMFRKNKDRLRRLR